MSVSVAEPDVEIMCDCCGESLDEAEEIYCSDCFDGAAEGTAKVKRKAPQSQCSRCHKECYRDRMISKVDGIMCVSCAHKHELELLAALTPVNKSVDTVQASG